MSASTLLWLVSVAVSAGCAIVAARRNDRSGYALFKPLTTFIILLGAAWLIWPAPSLYRSVIVLGLALSLAGDILLLLPAKRFIAGLVAFLFAHVAYLVAFGFANPVAVGQLVWLLPFVALAALVLADRWRAAGRLRGPMLVYAAVLCAMAWRAAMRGQAAVIPRQTFLFGFLGACLFAVSDAILTLRRFGRPFAAAQTLELATYWAAQILIALSVRATPR
jgi:uncharacterized membrane protein YhhN